MNVRTPGLKTTSDHGPDRLALYWQHAYAWIAYQAQNGGDTRSFDLRPAKDAGLSAGVWGVSYNAGDFLRDGELLGRQAILLGADHVTMDVEMAAKGTRQNRGLGRIIDGLRLAGWTGPVSLNTMGPPHNPDVNDYEIDVASFLDTGGGVATQAYFNETDAFRPALAVSYWTRVGVPRDRLNLTISLYPSEADKEKPGTQISGAGWVPLLEEAGLGRAFSIFMAEAATAADLDALDAISKAPPPDEGDLMEKIGTEHGIDGFTDWLRTQPGVKPRGPKYDENDVRTWPMPDRIERTLKALVADHDERAE